MNVEATARMALEQVQARPAALLIDNEWVPAASGRRSPTYDPSTGEMIADYAVSDVSDISQAVAAAKQAQVKWAALTLAERASYLPKLKEELVRRRELFAAIDSMNGGLSYGGMLSDVNRIIDLLDIWPGLARAMQGQVLHDGTPGLHYTRFAPYGVVAKIIAYNHPFQFAMKGTIPALLAGNTAVLKPADQTPLSLMLLGEVIREILPAGVLNIVTGGAEAGEAMVTHHDIRRVAFTGSVRTGLAIQARAAQDNVRHITLELGGKNAMIVFSDVDVKQVVQNIIFGMNLQANAGQSCGSTSRIFAHRDVYQALEKELGEALGRMRLGPSYAEDTDMGPVVDSAAVERVGRFVQGALDEGAKLVSGGAGDSRLPESGNFVAPTLLSEVRQTFEVAREEVFGPVLSMLPWDDYEAMIDDVNSVDYGLTASVWTNDLSAALRTVDRVEAGYVWVNHSTAHYFGMPFGGWKNSGLGKEECLAEYESFLQAKSVNIRL